MTEKEFKHWEAIAKETKAERESFRVFVERFYERYYRKKFVWNWHFDVVVNTILKTIKKQMECSDEERETKVLIFNVPPRSGKTEILCKLLPVWLKGHQENLNFMTSGYSYNLMKGFSMDAKNYWKSKEFKATFPWRKELDSDGKDSWGHKNGGMYYATGAGGSITGKGCDLFLIDDPLKPNSVARTGNELDHINSWFGNTVISRLNPDGLKIICVIMQRLEDNDLCGYLLENFKAKFDSGEYEHISTPAIAEKDDEYRKAGESFFPARFSLADLKQKKEIMDKEKGAHFFSAQYQQEPLDLKNAEFKRKMFVYELEKGEYVVRKWIGVDVALSEKASSDWRAFVCVGKTNKGRFIALDNYHSRKNSNVVLDALFDFQQKWDCPVIIEANGAQKYFYNAVKKEMTHREYYFYLKDISARGDKNARLRATLLPLYENGRIVHTLDLKGGEMEKEILRFPKSKHDDNMDALETAISAFRDFGEEKEEGTPPKNKWDDDEVFGDGKERDPKKAMLKMLNKTVKDESDDEWDSLLWG